VLWSDPEDEPTKELRETQEMLRRAGLVLALAVCAVMVLLVLGVL
jgi:hypothetical protein